MDLGNTGESSSLVWLYCDLHNWGRTSIKQGHRIGLPLTGPQLWVFCPLLKVNFPKDRELVENCKKCSHYKGVSHSTKISQQKDNSFKFHTIPTKKLKPRKVITENELANAVNEKKRVDKEWKKEEVRLQKC